MAKAEIRMTEGPIAKQLVSFAIPLFLGFLFQQLYNTADALIGFCRGIQAASPVDSYAAPEPSPEPGYTDEVIMASGSFTQGSTIELSCDGPLREPYTCYLQGGLNFAASRAGVLLAVQNAYFKD